MYCLEKGKTHEWNPFFLSNQKNVRFVENAKKNKKSNKLTICHCLSRVPFLLLLLKQMNFHHKKETSNQQQKKKRVNVFIISVISLLKHQANREKYGLF